MHCLNVYGEWVGRYLFVSPGHQSFCFCFSLIPFQKILNYNNLRWVCLYVESGLHRAYHRNTPMQPVYHLCNVYIRNVERAFEHILVRLFIISISLNRKKKTTFRMESQLALPYEIPSNWRLNRSTEVLLPHLLIQNWWKFPLRIFIANKLDGGCEIVRRPYQPIVLEMLWWNSNSRDRDRKGARALVCVAHFRRFSFIWFTNIENVIN